MGIGVAMFRERPVTRREFLQQSTLAGAAVGGLTLGMARSLGAASLTPRPVTIPDKLVVLTFDDAVKSQRTFVAPLLKDLGFRATFFVSHRWMPDHENFMTWEEIAEISRMGFEIGNHTWTHGDFSEPRGAAHLAGELALVERALAKVACLAPSASPGPATTLARRPSAFWNSMDTSSRGAECSPRYRTVRCKSARRTTPRATILC